MSTLALTSDALTQWGTIVLAAGDDLAPSNASGVNLNLGLWSTIAGFITPLLVALLQQPRLHPFVRALITVVASIGIAAATAAFEGQLTGTRWTTSTLIVLAAAVGTYQTLWKNVAPAIETATSSKQPQTATS